LLGVGLLTLNFLGGRMLSLKVYNDDKRYHQKVKNGWDGLNIFDNAIALKIEATSITSNV
jgi:hypothetical protein